MSLSQIEKDIAYLKLLLSTNNISRREEVEIRQELASLEEKRKASSLQTHALRLGVSLYGSYFGTDVKID
jgi:argininosuccinate lyase